jgi:PAS domain S-box-containing protein
VTGVYRSGDALFAIDEELRVVSWNDAAEELTGLSTEDAVGRPCWDVVGAVDTRGDLVPTRAAPERASCGKGGRCRPRTC